MAGLLWVVAFIALGDLMISAIFEKSFVVAVTVICARYVRTFNVAQPSRVGS